jgi:hypothetical protein
MVKSEIHMARCPLLVVVRSLRSLMDRSINDDARIWFLEPRGTVAGKMAPNKLPIRLEAPVIWRPSNNDF